MSRITTYGTEPIEGLALLPSFVNDISTCAVITDAEELPQSESSDFTASGVSSSINERCPPDEQLAIERTLAGDLTAFNTIVLKHQRVAYSVAFRMLHSREAAADAVQDSFLKAFRAVHSFRGGSFKSWLLRIVTNTCYDTLRQECEQSHSSFGDEVDSDDGPLSRCDPRVSAELPLAFVERMELRAHIELGLRMLPREQRLVIVMHDIHGLSYEEISEITGYPMGTVKSRISRARLKLRTYLLNKPELLPTCRWQHA